MTAVLRNELLKLMAQQRVRGVVLVLLVAPWVFILLILQQNQLPLETLYGRYLKTTGFATPLVVLAAASQYLFPLLAAVFAGDIFSAEDGLGTYQTILTRSVSREQVFWGKVAAAFIATTGLVVGAAVSSLVAGLVSVGTQPLIDVGSRPVAPSHAVVLVLVAWATVLPPVLGYSSLALLVSVATRSSVLGVIVPVLVGLGLLLFGFLNAFAGLRHLLLSDQFNTWRGLLDHPSYAGPFERGLLVCLVHVMVFLSIAYLVFRRRDVTR